MFCLFHSRSETKWHAPVLLIFDDHYSHIRNMDVIDLASSNQVTMLQSFLIFHEILQTLSKIFMAYYRKKISGWLQKSHLLWHFTPSKSYLGKLIWKCKWKKLKYTDLAAHKKTFQRCTLPLKLMLWKHAVHHLLKLNCFRQFLKIRPYEHNLFHRLMICCNLQFF